MSPIAITTMRDGALASRFEELDARFETLELRIRQLEIVAAELQQLKTLAGDLKFEMEQMRE